MRQNFIHFAVGSRYDFFKRSASVDGHSFKRRREPRVSLCALF